MKTVAELVQLIESRKAKSAWSKGVKEYALSLLENLPQDAQYYDIATLEKDLLNGAWNWKQYSEGGCSLIYDGDIADRLCSPSELKKTNYGAKQPNSRETWIDVQARALYQAARIIYQYL